MRKLLQNDSNLNAFECSRHLMARKIEKRPKNQRWKNPNFHNFLTFLILIGNKNSCGVIFFHFQALRPKRATPRLQI
jgi:hypothetical protein